MKNNQIDCLFHFEMEYKFNKCILQNKIFCRRRSKRETNGTKNGEYDYYDSNEGGVDAENDDTRIVNGYAAGKRPWLVLIITNNAGMCGGSLINHKYVPQNTGKYLSNFMTPIMAIPVMEFQVRGYKIIKVFA